VPYINFPLTVGEKDIVKFSSLVVGPAPHAPLALRAAKTLLNITNTLCPDPISSEIPFRDRGSQCGFLANAVTRRTSAWHDKNRLGEVSQNPRRRFGH
jgi:hypothetical protein